MAYTGLYNADGQQQVTIVNGSTYTGLYSPDGQYNGVTNDGTSVLLGAHHPCGAYNVAITTNPYAGSYAPNGSRYIIASSNGYALTSGSAVPATSPFTPLPGSVVDMDFLNNQFFPSPLATLMDGAHTGAIGPLATAFNGTDISILLQLKSLGAAPTGTIWITCNSFNPVFSGLSDTTFRSRKVATSLSATLGSGAFSTNSCKIAFASDSTTGRSLVGNNGSLVTDAQTWTAGSPTFSNVDSQWSRLTVWNTRLSDISLAGFTV